MGLDMWIYSGKKPEEDKIPEKPHADELDKLRLNYYIKEDIEEDLYLLKDLLPICIEREGTADDIDWARLRKDYNVPETAHCGGWSNLVDSCIFNYWDNDEKYTIDITDEKLDTYSIIRNVHFIITDLDEISYFRKEYGLQEDIYDVYHEYTGEDIQNCGYYHLTPEMIKELNERNKLFAKEYFGTFAENDDSLYYHEWY